VGLLLRSAWAIIMRSFGLRPMLISQLGAITMRTISSICALIMLTSCGVTGTEIGSGPITLSPGVKQALEEYRSLRTPYYFAVSSDGEAFGYTYCQEVRCRSVGDAASAVYSCERSGKECKIYARREEVVWQE
jgi:hypothetical protein